MSCLDSTTSSLAIIEAWNRSRSRLPQGIPADWMVRYFDPHTFYTRPLSDTEREGCGEDAGDPQDVWYGVFQHCDSAMIAVSDTQVSLFREADQHGAMLRYVN